MLGTQLLQPNDLIPILRRVTMQQIQEDLGEMVTPDDIPTLAGFLRVQTLAAVINDLEYYRNPSPGLAASIYVTLPCLWRAGRKKWNGGGTFDDLVAEEATIRPRRNPTLQSQADQSGRPVRDGSQFYYPHTFVEL